MRTRAITAIGIILVVLFPLVYGSWALEALAVVVVVSACYEWLHILNGFKYWGWYLVVGISAAVLGITFLNDRQIYALAAAMFLILWSLPVFTERMNMDESFSAIACYFFLAIAYISVRQLIGARQYLWTICFATYGSDTFAYLAGRYFGRHKMNPRISPKKTWEGFAGGVIGGFVLSYVFSTFFWSTPNAQLNFLLCLLCPVMAEIGDLCFSALKRHNHVKDFSELLPGHGGILDRTDSLLANIVLFGILNALI